MSDLNEKIAVVQNWINELQSNQPVDKEKSHSVETVLNAILGLIRPDSSKAASEKSIAEASLDLALRIQEQTTVLTRANAVLKSQIVEHEVAEVTLRQAHNDLEVQLQEHIGDLSR